MSSHDKLPPYSAVTRGARAHPRILVADIGGTWTRLATGGVCLDEAEMVKFRTLPDYSEMIGKIGNVSAVLLDGKKPDAVGFGIAGQMEGGKLTMAGKLQEYGYTGNDIATDISDQTGIDVANVAGMNDMVAAARAEQAARLRTGNVDTEAIYTLSTGFGGALFTHDQIIADEPGHQFYQTGAMCGCGGNGCLEAHVSGSGIERKYGVRGENIPTGDPRWQEITSNLVAGMDMTLDRYESDGHAPSRMTFFGSVAMKGPGVIDGLRAGIGAIRGEEAPLVEFATYGDDSGMYGAYFAALDTLRV